MFLFIFKLVYALVIFFDERKLVKEEKNTGAAIGYGGAIIGFAIALGSAASNSVAVVDFAIWAIVAVIAQSLAFGILRFSFMPKIAERINNSNSFDRYAAEFSAPTPPRWNKESTFFEQNKSRGWLQTFSLSGFAVAMSACALLTVLTGAQISIKDNGVALTFAHETNASDVDAAAQKKEQKKTDVLCM